MKKDFIKSKTTSKLPQITALSLIVALNALVETTQLLPPTNFRIQLKQSSTMPVGPLPIPAVPSKPVPVMPDPVPPDDLQPVPPIRPSQPGLPSPYRPPVLTNAPVDSRTGHQ
jgi:hypothetical protein